MISLGTCADLDFEAAKRAHLEAFRRRCGGDESLSGPGHVPGTVAQSLKPVAVMSHNPASWWTSRGSMSKRRQLEMRGLPSFKGWLFVTLTIDRRPEQGGIDCPEAAYLEGKEKLRRMIWRLRNDFGYDFDRYCWKLEFHKPDAFGRIYPHWHLLINCRGFMHKDHVERAWSLGHADAKRVRSDRNLETKGFGYVFKYAAKTIENIPDYILDSDKRVRAWQTSENFYKNQSRTRTGSKTKQSSASLRAGESVACSPNTQNAASSFFDEETSGEKTEAAPCAGAPVSVIVRPRTTLRDRLQRWSRSCVVISLNERGERRFRTFPLTCEWSRVPLNFWSYAARQRPDLMDSPDFSVSASSIQFPDDELFLRLPIAFGADRPEVEVQAVASDENPF